MNPTKPTDPSKPSNTNNTGKLTRLILLGLILVFVGALLYRSSLAMLTYTVLKREGSSHGVFVPFLSAFFLWVKRDILQKTEMRYDLLGIPIMVAGLLFPILSLGPYSLQSLGFIVFISGTIILFLGRGFFKEVSFPLLFLITLIPIPQELYSNLAERSRIISFGGSRWIISMLGIPFVRDGNLIYLHNATLEIAEECSGIRYLVSYFIFSLIYAWLFKKAFWSRMAVILSSIIISFTASMGRLTLIFILTYLFGPKMSEYWPHVIVSWSVFAIVIIISISMDQYFQGKQDRRQVSKEAEKLISS